MYCTYLSLFSFWIHLLHLQRFSRFLLHLEYNHDLRRHQGRTKIRKIHQKTHNLMETTHEWDSGMIPTSRGPSENCGYEFKWFKIFVERFGERFGQQYSNKLNLLIWIIYKTNSQRYFKELKRDEQNCEEYRNLVEQRRKI